MAVTTTSASPEHSVITDERILAAGTSLRFVLLLFLFVAGTYGITADVATQLSDGSRNDGIGCLLAAGGNPDLGLARGVLPAAGNRGAFQACVQRYVPDTSWAPPTVTVAMILVTAVLYRLLPIWKARRSRYLPLTRFDTREELSDVLAELVSRSKLPVKITIDDCCVDLSATSASAVVFGTRRHPRSG